MIVTKALQTLWIMWHDYDSEKEIQKVGDFSIKQTSDTVIFWEKKKQEEKSEELISIKEMK